MAAPGGAPATGVARGRERPRLTPARVVLGCAALAILSTLVAPTPSYDPWAWIIWGRELAGLSDLGFSTATATGWKPLPVLVTTPLALLGTGLAPAAWVAVVRTAALLAVVLAGRLAHRAAGWPAAAATVAFLLVSPQALELATGGASEAIVLALLLLGIERHLDGARPVHAEIRTGYCSRIAPAGQAMFADDGALLPPGDEGIAGQFHAGGRGRRSHAGGQQRGSARAGGGGAAAGCKQQGHGGKDCVQQ